MWLTLAVTGLVTAYTLYSGKRLEGAPRIPDAEMTGGSLAVILPARDEERNIEQCVTSLLRAVARYGDATVLVVDDGSSDNTPAILDRIRRDHPEGNRLTILRLDEALPQGWLGKPRACWAGTRTEQAREADWLLFIDADTRSQPDLLGRLMAGAVTSGADLYSIFPHQILEGIAERLTMPHLFYVLAVGFPWHAVNDPDSPLAVANGQCILVRRTVYEATGGHRAVRNAIAEDKALAEQVKRAGYHLYLADGREVMATRMYTSLGEIWEGWTKNAYLGLGDRSWLLLVAVFLGLSGAVFPYLALWWTVRRRRWWQALPWAATLITVLRNRDRAMRELGVPRWYALTVPVGTLLCSAIAFHAWYRVVSGQGVTWKGRRYTPSATMEGHS